MVQYRVLVDPPVPIRPPYGLLDVADVREDARPHWRTGVEYDTYACHESKVWGHRCTGTGLPPAEVVQRAITVTIEGTSTGGTEPEFGVALAATVDGGPTRQIRASLVTATGVHTAVTETGAGPVTVIDGLDDPIDAASLSITDVLTGVTGTYPVQQLDNGQLESPVSPVVIAVAEQGVPEGCDGIETTFTAADGSVTVAAATTADETRRLAIYLDGHRAVIDTGDSDTIADVPPGMHRIAVRDIDSWSYVSGWLWIDDDGTGQAVLIQATCPVKDVSSPPWQTLIAEPVTIYAEVICKTVAFEDASQAAARALELSGPRTMERYYWETLIERGQPQTTDPVTVVRAVAELEQYLASNYNGLGVIHVAPWGIAYLAAADVLDETATGDERLRTWRGTPIVVGSGYLREGSDATVTGEDFYMFATGQIAIYVAPDTVREALDKPTNDLYAIAERTFVVLDDCPQPAAVHVTPGGAA